MLGKKFDTLCYATAFVSIIIFSASIRFVEKPFLDSPVLLFIFITSIVAAYVFVMIGIFYRYVEGIDKNKGLDDEVAVFARRAHSSREESRVVVTVLSTDSKREIKNILEEIEKLIRTKEGIFAKLIVPLLLAIASTTLYLVQNVEISRGTLAITIAFVSTFSAFYCCIQMYFDTKLGAKNNAIAKIGMKNQHIPDGKGSTETIKPFIFKFNYENIEGYPVTREMGAWHFYLLLDELRTSERKSELYKIFKDFILTENSRMRRVEKAKTNYMLMERLDNLAKKTNKSYLYSENI